MPLNMCKICIKTVFYCQEFILKCRKSEKLLQTALDVKAKNINKEREATVFSIKTNECNDKDVSKDLNEDEEVTLFYIKDDDCITDALNYRNEVDDFFSKSFCYTVAGDSVTKSDCKAPNANLWETQEASNAIETNNIKNPKSRLKKLKNLKQITTTTSSKIKRKFEKKIGPPYTCITCHSIFDTREELKKHKIENNHRKSLKYTCEHCKKMYDTHSKFVEHCRIHTGEKPNICQACGKAFNFKTDLKRHMFMHEEIKPYACRYCDKTFTRKQYLQDHERKHTGEKLICSLCGRGFHSYSTLIYHEKTHKVPPGVVRDPLEPNEKHYKCKTCSKVLLTEQTLKAHLMLHGPKNFSCEKCGKTYISKQRLHDHFRFAHQDQNFECIHCEKVYKHKTALTAHMKTHSGENVYKCEKCSKKFSCKGSLYQHRRIHSGDTTYQCQQCKHICLNKRHLENHLRVHTGEKPFACPQCGKAFAQKANMVAHSRMHRGEKNYLCKECGKGFNDRRSLHRHNMAIHEVKEVAELVNQIIPDRVVDRDVQVTHQVQLFPVVIENFVIDENKVLVSVQ